MTRFAGFPPETFAFLADLRANNRRDWFEANRDRYEAFWKAPALAFIDALRPGMAALAPPLLAEARIGGSLRRINRDVRFSTDKSPYEPWLHLIFSPGTHPGKGAGLHVVLRPEGVGIGAGRWAFDGPILARYRERLADPAARAALLAALAAAAGIGCQLDPPHLKTVPPGHPSTPEWAHLLGHKGIVVRTGEGRAMPGWIADARAVDEVLDRARSLLPLIAWLHDL